MSASESKDNSTKDIEENRESGTKTSGSTEEGGGNILVAPGTVWQERKARL